MNKKKLLWFTLPIGLVTLYFAFAAFINYIDPPIYDVEPTKSRRNEVMVYNGGCCLILEDLSVWLSNESGNNYPLYNHPSPPLNKSQIVDLPKNSSGLVQVTLSFDYGYYTEGHAKFVAMEFKNLEALKKDGLLIKFGDGDLRVQSGKREAFFSYDKAPWAE